MSPVCLFVYLCLCTRVRAAHTIAEKYRNCYEAVKKEMDERFVCVCVCVLTRI